MDEANEYLMKYLEAKRHLWNTYFVDIVNGLYECQPLDRFEEIDKNLFFSLVCYPLDIEMPKGFRFGSDCIEEIIVRQKHDMQEIPVMLSKPSQDGNKYWDKIKEFNMKEVRLSFIEFFEWDKYGFLSLPMARCKIVDSGKNPEYQGREVLVENYLIDFYCAKN